MGAESNAKAIPKIVKLNTAFKLAESWVKNMSGSTTEEPKPIELVGRPPRLGLGAREIPNSKAIASPVERKLLGKLNAGKKKLPSKVSKKDCPAEESTSSGDDDDDEPESRTNAVAKKRAPPLVTTPQSKKQK